MENFIIITLLFLDNNTNNIFDYGDKIIDINKPGIEKNVYCKLQNSEKKELCGYSSLEDDNFRLTDKLFEELRDKHYIFNTEIFEKGFKPGRSLYVEVQGDKYNFINNESEINNDSVIYSLSNDDSLYMEKLKNRTIYLVLALCIILIGWLFLFPKKK